MKKNLLKIFGFSFLIAVIPLLIVATMSRQELRKAAVGELADAANLSLVTTGSASVDVGGLVEVEVRLNTGGQNVDGVDIILEFNQPDPVLELTDIIPNTATNFKTFLPITGVGDGSESLDKTTLINKANSTNQIEFGAATFNMGDANDPDDGDITAPVSGTDVLIATLIFEAVGEGSSDLNFGYSPSNLDETRDTNVVTHNGIVVDDILLSATGVSVGVFGETCQHKPCGDADCNDVIDGLDFAIFVNEINGLSATMNADFNDDNAIDGLDFFWYVNGMNDLGGCNAPHL